MLDDFSMNTDLDCLIVKSIITNKISSETFRNFYLNFIPQKYATLKISEIS